MTTRTAQLSFAIVTAFALAAACGGNDESSGGTGGSGGTAPTAGTTSGGGTNTAGTTTDVGGVNAAGEATAGGTGTVMQPQAPGCPAALPEAGTACMRRGGGACTYGADSCLCNANAWVCYSQADCPAAAPADAAMCDLNGMSCAYDTLRCTCSTMNGWACQEPCPQAQPAEAAECRRPAALACRYQAGMVVQGFMDMADTTCACNDGNFTCFTQEDCPAAAPTTGDSCDMTTLACTYTGERCSCGADGAWTCTTDCPATLPADGTACERAPQQTCRYNGDTLAQGMGMQSDGTCTCTDGKFKCLTAADCPAAQPSNATTCDLGGLTCRYDAESCRCGTMSGMWTCFGGFPGAGGAGSGGANGAGGAQ